MKAPLFLVADLPDEDRYRLEGPEGHHAATVRRLRAGEVLLLGDGRGGLAECAVTSAGRDTLDLAVRRRWSEPAPSPRLVAVQALAKGDRGELAVQAMTEIGVDVIVPWSASRAVVRWHGERAGKALGRWRAAAREAAKQARRAWLPEVPPIEGSEAVGARLRAAAMALLLHGDAPASLATVDLPASGDIVVVVGPEGGITPDELDELVVAGGRPVRLGGTVLRTSTAGVAAMAVICSRIGRWA